MQKPVLLETCAEILSWLSVYRERAVMVCLTHRRRFSQWFYIKCWLFLCLRRFQVTGTQNGLCGMNFSTLSWLDTCVSSHWTGVKRGELVWEWSSMAALTVSDVKVVIVFLCNSYFMHCLLCCWDKYSCIILHASIAGSLAYCGWSFWAVGGVLSSQSQSIHNTLWMFISVSPMLHHQLGLMWDSIDMRKDFICLFETGPYFCVQGQTWSALTAREWFPIDSDRKRWRSWRMWYHWSLRPLKETAFCFTERVNRAIISL